MMKSFLLLTFILLLGPITGAEAAGKKEVTGRAEPPTITDSYIRFPSLRLQFFKPDGRLGLASVSYAVMTSDVAIQNKVRDKEHYIADYVITEVNRRGIAINVNDRYGSGIFLVIKEAVGKFVPGVEGKDVVINDVLLER
jgi:hypothetical protein